VTLHNVTLDSHARTVYSQQVLNEDMTTHELLYQISTKKQIPIISTHLESIGGRFGDLTTFKSWRESVGDFPAIVGGNMMTYM